MRKLLILLVAPLSVFSQNDSIFPIDSATHLYTFKQVIVEENQSSSELFSKAKASIAIAFKSAKDVVQSSDETSKTIIAKGLFKCYITDIITREWGYCRFILTIECKDGKYRYTLTGFEHFDPLGKFSGGPLELEKPVCGTFYFPKKKWREMKNDIYNDANELLSEIRKNMKKSPLSDNW